uniref:Clusterin n=1 Tax=Macaca mulatta TaxID=9544 RepID=A0A5F8AC78_MACMU
MQWCNHGSLYFKLPGSSDPSSSGSGVAGITEACEDSRIGGTMKTLLLFVGLLLTWESGQVLGDQTVSDNELQEMSDQGSKYLNKEIQNAVNGVKEIKTLIEKTNEERKTLLSNLEEAKKKKEDALNETRESETKLKEFPGVCNETMMALWEESRGVPEPELTLLLLDKWRPHRLPAGERPAADTHDGCHAGPLQPRIQHHGRALPGQPFLEMIHEAQQAMDIHFHSPAFQHPPTEFIREGDDDRTVCREIRHNSTGCLRMKDQCDKCREILSVDCSANNPAQAQLRRELSESLQVAERLTRKYNELLQSYQWKMLNTSSLLEQLNEQFNWVSQLANLTQGEDQYYLRVTTVASHTSDSGVPSGVTEVVVKLFDSDPITVTVPVEVSRKNPKFMETVVEKALQEYRKKQREK